MDTFSLAVGSALPIQVQLADEEGNPASYFAPIPTLSAEVWPGGRRQLSFAASATWADASAGLVIIGITATQSAGLQPGRYLGRLHVHDFDLGDLTAYEWAVEVEFSPGDQPAPPTYCTLADLLNNGRGWLPTVRSKADQAGYEFERGRARVWLDDLILAAYPAAVPYQMGSWAAGSSALPNPAIRAQLDADLLARRGWVAEATSWKALAYICEGQAGLGDLGPKYATMARAFHNQARNLALSSTAEVGGVPINLAAGSLR